jgi:uncharacterized protein (DUF3084 family)
MKRNIVILLCLVFFTQSAFADWGIWCDDCHDERNACRRELSTCYRNNGYCQNLHKNESAQIKELTTQKDTCLRETDSWKNKAMWLLGGIGFLVCAVGACGWHIYRQGNKINDQAKQLTDKDVQIADRNARIAARDADIQDMFNILQDE